MPYNKQVYRVLGGSLNLRGAPTEIPDNDFPKIINAAYDQDNVLRTRRGHELICTASGPIKQMIRALEERWQAINDAYIVGFKDFLWKMGSGGADKACTPIITEEGPRKSDGESDWSWGIAAPTEKCTAAAEPPVETTVVDFQETFVGSPADRIDNAKDGFLTFHNGSGPDDDTMSAYVDIELDLKTGHDLDDVHKITLWSNKWHHIKEVIFEVDVGDGNFQNDYYTARMMLRNINVARKEETTFYIRARPQAIDTFAEDKKRYTWFDRIGQTTDKDWRSCDRVRVKANFKPNTNAKLAFYKWVVVGDENNTIEGDDLKYYYTWVNDALHESNPSPPSDPITINRGSARLTDFEEATDPQVTGMNIYTNRAGAIYKINDEPLPLDEDVVDQESNDDLTNRGVQMEDDNDLPPEADGIADHSYYGRILGFKGSRVYWSKQNKPYAFVNPDGPDGDWVDIDSNAGKIKWITVRMHEAWIYAENDIFILVGDPADAFGEVHPSGIAMGTPSRTGVAKAGAGTDVVYLKTGIYLVDGSNAVKLTQQLDPIFKGRESRLWDGTITPPISDPSTVAVGYEDGIIRVSYDSVGLICELASRRWFQDSRDFTCFQAEGEDGVLGGTQDGDVLKLEFGVLDAGVPISVDFLTKAYDFGIQDNEKRLEDVTIYHDTAAQDFTVTIYVDEGVPIFTGPINSFGRDRTVLQINGGDGYRSRNFAVRIQGATPFEIFIYAIDFNYYPEAREAKSYDTAVSNAGSNKVKLIRELLPSLENDTGVEFRLETDLPGHALTQKESHAVGVNLFRRAEPIVMTAERYGHDFRVVASGPAGHFRLFEMHALVQIIGTYLHGAKGEYYLSDPLDFGSERVKMIKEIEVVYSTLGTVTATISTDLPGNAIVARGLASFPATIGEQSIKVKLPGTIKGRLFQFRLDSTGDCRVEAIRVFMKMIGEPNATPWQWVELPLAKTQDAIWTPLTFPQDQVA